MNRNDLIEEINIELDNIKRLVDEIKTFNIDLHNNEPELTVKTAIGTYLAQIYNGIENILKRFCKLHNINLPKGEFWHIELFKRFCNPPYMSLPIIFNTNLENEFTALRKFRHVVFHGYAF